VGRNLFYKLGLPDCGRYGFNITMKRPTPIRNCSAALLPALVALLAMTTSAAQPGNTLTAEEKAAGWKLLFDGQSLRGWRLYNKKAAPESGWKVEEGILKKLPKQRGGDIVTESKFEDFDLSWEWRITAGGNNGVKYLVTEERTSAPGHEYQMIDDDGHPDGKLGAKRQTASFYEVLPPAADKPLKPPGEWNSSRVLIQGNHVEHWLNGAKVLEYELGSDVVKAGVATSKFKNAPGFGTKIKGHIMLTDHQDECWFRNIKIRELPAK
jgi:hypothetical protein